MQGWSNRSGRSILDAAADEESKIPFPRREVTFFESENRIAVESERPGPDPQGENASTRATEPDTVGGLSVRLRSRHSREPPRSQLVDSEFVLEQAPKLLDQLFAGQQIGNGDVIGSRIEQ